MISVKNESQVLNLPIEDIIPNRFQPRLNFDDNGLKELAASIKEHGIIQPLVVRKIGEKYEIIAGERRYKASKMAGLSEIPAIVTQMDDKKSAEAAIIENIQRKDLSAIEEAKSYEALLDKGYTTQDKLAQQMGLSQSAISNKLRLLSLSDNVQKALMESKISERHARSLLQLKTHEEQDEWLKIIIDERLTVKELDERLKGNKKKEDDSLLNLNKNNDSSDKPGINLVFDEKPIPNKFFNFLEDEEANMTMTEKTDVTDTPINEFKMEATDDVEMLDFVPAIPKKDMTIAIELVEKLKNDLKANNFQVSVLEDNSDDELKYKIIISKN